LKFSTLTGTGTISRPQRATGVFRGATKCGYGPTKGSESPFATEGKAGGGLLIIYPLRYRLAIGDAGDIYVQAGEGLALHLGKHLGEEHLLTFHLDQRYPLATALEDADRQVLVGREVDGDLVLLGAVYLIAKGELELQEGEFLLLASLFGSYPIGMNGLLEVELAVFLEVDIVADVVLVGTALELEETPLGR